MSVWRCPASRCRRRRYWKRKEGGLGIDKGSLESICWTFLSSSIHILPVVSQILRLSKPFISCYFVMSSEGLWACCLLLIGYKDGSLLRENLNFLMVNARGYFGLGDLLHLVSISNELYNSGLLASTYLKIIGLKVHYSIGREFFQTTSQTPKLYSCKQKP